MSTVDVAGADACAGQNKQTVLRQEIPEFVHEREDRSLRTEVSVAGKRNFEGRDKAAESAVKAQKRRCRDKISLNNPAHSGGIRRELGNLR